MLDKINGAVFDKHAVRTISPSTHHHPVTQCTTHKAPKTAIGEKTCVCGDNIQQKNSLLPPPTRMNLRQQRTCPLPVQAVSRRIILLMISWPSINPCPPPPHSELLLRTDRNSVDNE